MKEVTSWTVIAVAYWLVADGLFNHANLVVIAASPLLVLNLSGALIDERFGDLNADSEAAPAPLASVRLIEAVAELRLTWDGRIYTAASFPLSILQSLISAP